MRRDLKHRLAPAEIVATSTRWAGRPCAGVKFSGLIRERLAVLGIDPAVSLRRDEEAATELSRIPDTDKLRAADEAIVGLIMPTISTMDGRGSRRCATWTGEP